MDEAIVKDHEGVEWLPLAEAALQLALPEGTVRSWAARGKVAGFRIRGRRWVRMPDVMAAEHATRGAYVALRRDNCNTGAQADLSPDVVGFAMPGRRNPRAVPTAGGVTDC